MFESISAVTNSAGYLLGGVGVTLLLVGFSLLIGFICGIILTLGQVYGPRPVRWFVGVYVWFFRGLPNIVLLFLFYFALFPFMSWDMPVFGVAVTVLGLRSAAYQSQIFRGAIQSLSEGQMLAARSLGMTKWQAIRSIILPQSLRLSLPGWSNEYPVLLTDSAVAYVIGVAELLTRTSQVISRTGEPMLLYLTCAVIFILLNYGGMMIIQYIEKKVRIPGFGNNEAECL
ncbi:polar amino acid ABC transporter, inner membrane subunit [Methanocorpusculum labreanum Z]|uniref:Polar amino acid ABC transporter, inner membrane subunit n=1 Tax=Methanocorpusculum labreanum (strain ATCC 43576 / DSM 4855 / Z) TaxID=410358 RepID=A2STE6_METLZ|nr:amino acid ABC transporter permease [Methanocorpusculum labreanum]ABN07602.1 polar amino acid ABC transporter, inner membrane subunit [Methanocorpusculum labreanum Z]